MRSQPPFGYVRRPPPGVPAVISASGDLSEDPAGSALLLIPESDPQEWEATISVGRTGGTLAVEVSWTAQAADDVTITEGDSGTLTWEVDDFVSKSITIRVTGFSAPFGAAVLLAFVAESGCTLSIPGGTTPPPPEDEVPEGSAFCAFIGF